MYQTLRRTFYWPSMAMDTYNTVRNCVACAKERISLRKHASFLKLFPATAPLEFVSIDILGPLPRTTTGFRYLLVISDRYSKLTRTVPLRDIKSVTIARAFCEHWVFQYGPPTYVLSDNGGQFTSKFFQSICSILGARNLFTAAYHPQTNGQVERFNRTILSGLRHFCSDHGRDWDKFVHAVTFGYNSTVHRVTGSTPFELVLAKSPSPLNLSASETIPHGTTRLEKDRFRERLKALMASATKQMSTAQARYKRNFDRRVNPLAEEIKVNDLVFVKRETPTEAEDHEKRNRLIAAGDHKLRSKTVGPYPVTKVTSHNVRIIRDGMEQTISKDRVVKCPGPSVQSPTIVEDPSTGPTLAPVATDVAIQYPADRHVVGEGMTSTFTQVLARFPTHATQPTVQGTDDDANTPDIIRQPPPVDTPASASPTSRPFARLRKRSLATQSNREEQSRRRVTRSMSATNDPRQ